MTTENAVVRRIRKYKNRKLYDLQSHEYITLGDVLSLYKEGTTLSITGPADEDITEEILFQSVIATKTKDPTFRKMVIDNA
jgi:polyhydroxyalkanoate synthesis regulator protein